MRHRLVDADRSPELLARLGVPDSELERLLCDADRLERERGKLRVVVRARVEELLAAVYASRLFEQDRPFEKAEIGELVLPPPAVREHGSRLAPQQLLFFGERELHQRL